jgi:hypothetical protein
MRWWGEKKKRKGDELERREGFRVVVMGFGERQAAEVQHFDDLTIYILPQYTYNVHSAL